MSDRFAILQARMRGAARGKPVPMSQLAPVPSSAPAVQERQYLRFEDVAAETGVSVRTARSWEANGLRVCRPSSGVAIIRRVDLDAFLLQHVDTKRGGADTPMSNADNSGNKG